MPDKMKELEELEKKATKGPWVFAPAETEVCGSCPVCEGKVDGQCKDMEYISGASPGKIFTIDLGDYHGMNEANAKFISALRNATPALIEGWKIMKEALKEIDRRENIYGLAYKTLVRITELEKGMGG